MTSVYQSHNTRNIEKYSIFRFCLNYEVFKKMDLNLQVKLVSMIESSILDASIDKARERNIPVYWNSDDFIEQYSNLTSIIY